MMKPQTPDDTDQQQMVGGQGLSMQDTIMQSMKVMQQFMMEMKSRMDRLEDNVCKVQSSVNSVMSHTTPSSSGLASTTTNSAANAPHHSLLNPSPTNHPLLPPPQSNTALYLSSSHCSPPSSASSPHHHHSLHSLHNTPGRVAGANAGAGIGVAGSLRLRLPTAVECMWYTDRPFPPFSLEIVDQNDVVFTRAEEWEIAIHLLDGYNRYIDDKLCQNERARRVVTFKGAVTIAGLRFYAVSSKNGGHFTLEFEVKSPREVAPLIAPLKSTGITVLSCRLFHNPKAPLEKLKADDSLSMMPGIGRLYAQRFQHIGITTIAKLADLKLDTMSQGEQQHLLDSLRKDKGTMTRVKLEEYIAQAREVLQRSPDPSPPSPQSSPAAKRMKTGTPTNYSYLPKGNLGLVGDGIMQPQVNDDSVCAETLSTLAQIPSSNGWQTLPPGSLPLDQTHSITPTSSANPNPSGSYPVISITPTHLQQQQQQQQAYQTQIPFANVPTSGYVAPLQQLEGATTNNSVGISLAMTKQSMIESRDRSTSITSVKTSDLGFDDINDFPSPAPPQPTQQNNVPIIVTSSAPPPATTATMTTPTITLPTTNNTSSNATMPLTDTLPEPARRTRDRRASSVSKYFDPSLLDEDGLPTAGVGAVGGQVDNGSGAQQTAVQRRTRRSSTVEDLSSGII